MFSFAHQASAESASDFVLKYISIRNASDVTGYLQLIHPKCLEHFKNVGKKHFPKNIFLAFRKRLGLVSNNANINIEKWEDTKSSLIYPIQPTHIFSITWQDDDGNSKSISESQLVQEKHQWFLVIPDYPK
jgi:hypothetical protein